MTSYPQPPTRMQILLAEDDEADVALVEDAFATHGLTGELHCVRDGVEALAFLRRDDPYADAPRPDLVLLDLNMPRMSGRDVLAAVKADEGLKTIPVVVFSTSAVPADVVDSYGSHANAYVTKPIDLEAFEQVITQIHGFYGDLVTRPPGGPHR
jgi:CheY-like chemotaxis protein